MPPKNENGYPWLQWKVDELVVDDEIDQWLNLSYESARKIPETVYITTGRRNGKSAAMAEYIKNDIETTNTIYNTLKEKKDMDKRTMMHKLQKEMYVEIFPSMVKGFVKAFDYTHFKVGVSPENYPSYMGTLLWVDPDCITIIKTPAKSKPTYTFPKPRKVIADVDAGVTVVLWDDGTKTIVRAAEGEQPDIYDAFCAAFCKRIYGTNSALKRELNKVLEIKEKK